MCEEKEIEFQTEFKVEVQELGDFMLSSSSENRIHQKWGKQEDKINSEVRNVDNREYYHA